MDNLKEMDKFLETYYLLRLNQKEKENLNKTITTNEIEALIIIKKSPIEQVSQTIWLYRQYLNYIILIMLLH